MAEKLLIVDDDLETLRLVGIMLQRQGYQIVAANNGTQALSVAKAELPDLILLDIMMPDMDGYEVARHLRADPTTASIPILMFTAKSQVEDKVAGYDVGADDYLTKPTHPAELSAHIKALLSRVTKGKGVTTPTTKGYVVAVMAAKGGVGASTIALNLAVTLFQKEKLDAIAAEFRPGNGVWAQELGYTNNEGLQGLFQYKPTDINREVVEKELVANASGIRLLMSSSQPKDIDAVGNTAHLEAVLNQLTGLAPITIVDIGNNTLPGIDKILNLVNEIILVVEPHPTVVAQTKVLLDDLANKGFGRAKLVTVVLVNRIRSDIQLSWSQVQEQLNQPVAVVFTPVPELAYHSALRYTPMVMLQSDGLHAQQFGKLAEVISQHTHKA